MGSSRQQDRSLGGGISLPQWMKGKMDSRFDFDDSAFSPPSHDDSFFYLRYPKPQTSQATPQGFKSIDEVLNESSVTASTNQVTSGKAVPDFKEVKEVDFSKHPPPCQPFISPANSKPDVKPPKTISAAGNAKSKSLGTDDGFHSESALCGKSIVDVATQMMSGKFSRVAPAEPASQPPAVDRYLEASRKGSKSLPATPLTSPNASPDSSPKARRKLQNRYFTGPFVPDREKYQGGWILASLLGQSREIVTAKIDEEDETGLDFAPPKALSRKKSISSQNLTYLGKDEKSMKSTKSTKSSQPSAFNVLEAKPSELREMNFWSPTSM